MSEPSSEELYSKLGIGQAKLFFQRSIFLNQFMETRIEFFHRGYASCQLTTYDQNPSCPNHVNDEADFDMSQAFPNGHDSSQNCDFCIHFIHDFLPSLKKDWMEKKSRGIFYAGEDIEHRPNFKNFEKMNFHKNKDINSIEVNEVLTLI